LVCTHQKKKVAEKEKENEDSDASNEFIGGDRDASSDEEDNAAPSKFRGGDSDSEDNVSKIGVSPVLTC
jgi:hypothetical protein